MNSLKNVYHAQASHFYKISLYCLSVAFLVGCDTKSTEDAAPILITGKEVVYQLFSTSEFNVSGKITFQERVDGTIEAVTSLENTSGIVLHPVHIHAGSMTENGQLLSVLNPVQGSKGTSTTTLKSLMVSESKPFLFSDLATFNGSIRIHLNDGNGQNTILAIANIGLNQNLLDANFAICNDW